MSAICCVTDADRFAFEQQVQQRRQLRGRSAGQDLADRFQPQLLVVQFVENLPAAGQPQLEREVAGQLHEETVQRADPQAMQFANQFLQQPMTVGRAKIAIDRADQFAAGRLVERRFGQSHQHSAEDFAGRLACERRCQYLLRRLAIGCQLQVAIRKLVGLAGAGRSSDHHVRPVERSSGHDSASSAASAARLAAPNTSS